MSWEIIIDYLIILSPAVRKKLETNRRQNYFCLTIRQTKLSSLRPLPKHWTPEAESKEKHGVWNPMPELTITSPYVRSRVNCSTFTMVDPMP
jgi:hypothetical protein